MTWTAGPLLGFDTETTGVDVSQDRIVSAALVRRDSATTDVRTWLLDPGVPIPPEASAIHGITTEVARAEGQDPAGAIDEIAKELAGALSSGIPVVAFNATFDLCILQAELDRYGLPSLEDRIDGRVAPVIDPLVLDRALDRYRRGPRKLVDLCGVYAVVGDGELHTADVDVIATLDVLHAMLARYPELAERELDALHLYQADEHRRWAESFNSWRERKGLTGPGAELTWLRDHRQTGQRTL
ncbi:exonuclease domain-containing protein [Sanguibacter inulinus]|uniref:DNA polymerase III subunit epsilon n=1 Tax=Sanguibacter inulinus TaxID=60922 RepID=A0A853ENJ4_9MICO|nr:exonuclease domain-containing protein [Sanguibacter inulinus]MBF0720975.1 DNA polymerase III subunit epsilon [Sanguibacter inulinus]NYS92120.1 DNA polymerase III subunit epsilon [Sanguibacter inulinus]